MTALSGPAADLAPPSRGCHRGTPPQSRRWPYSRSLPIFAWGSSALSFPATLRRAGKEELEERGRRRKGRERSEQSSGRGGPPPGRKTSSSRAAGPPTVTLALAPSLLRRQIRRGEEERMEDRCPTGVGRIRRPPRPTSPIAASAAGERGLGRDLTGIRRGEGEDGVGGLGVRRWVEGAVAVFNFNKTGLVNQLYRVVCLKAQFHRYS